MMELGNSRHDEHSPPLERDDLFLAQLNALWNSIEHGATPLCSLDKGIQTLRVNLAILNAIEQPQWTTIEPQ